MSQGRGIFSSFGWGIIFPQVGIRGVQVKRHLVFGGTLFGHWTHAFGEKGTTFGHWTRHF